MQTAQPNTLLVAGALVEPGWVAPEAIARELGAPPWAQSLDARTDLRVPADAVPAAAHDLWLRDHFFPSLDDPGALSTARRIGALPSAALDSLDASRDAWLLEPAHFHLSRDHVALVHGALASLDRDDATALAAAIEPTLRDAGLACIVATPHAWLAQARDARRWTLRAPGSESAWGRNVDAWLPEGPDARAWRRVLNEIQMTWHTHAVNAARAARRELPANAVWLGGPVSPALVARWRDTGSLGLVFDDSALRHRLSDDREGWLGNLGPLAARIGATLDAAPAARVVLAGEQTTRTLTRAGHGPASWWRRLRGLASGREDAHALAGWFHEVVPS
ncbi:MAG: hypothetical protein AB7P21_04325 [Lautropia sp.]